VNDAWIFLSIGDAVPCGEWASLAMVLTMADSINHSVPTVEELEGSISKLIAAGLVDSDGTRTRLTSAGCEALRIANAPPVGHIQRFLELGHAWEKQAFPPNAARSWRLAPDSYREAFVERG
jgi:hypothetical protein